MFLILCLLVPVPCTATETALHPDTLHLTPAERAWLKKNKSIRIGGPANFPPFHYFDEKGNVKGIAADYLFMIANQIGLFVDVAAKQPWPRVLEGIQSGKIDLIPCVAKTAGRDAFLNYSMAYLSFPLVIVSRKDAPFIGGIDDLHGKRLAVIEKNATPEWLARDHIDFEPVVVGSPLDRIKAVALGRVDAGIENLATASYLIQQYGFTNVKIAAPTPYGSYNLHMAAGKHVPELQGIINKALKSISPEQHMRIRNQWLSVRYEHGLRRADIIKWIIVIGLAAGLVVAVILIWNRKLQNEIGLRKEAELELKRMALTDALTGADNRRSFMEKGANELHRARRYRHPFSFLMMDVDGFKAVNDTYGHQVGDAVLKKLVLQSNRIIRANDILCRLGGEEFAVILPETNAGTALEVCERLRLELSGIVVDSGRGPVRFTVSIGLAVFEKEADTLESIMRRADAALYQAKKGGKNRVVSIPAFPSPLPKNPE